MRILVFILLVSSIGPLIRFYKNKFFYYFFLSAIVNPIVYFVTSILGYTNRGCDIYIFANLLMIYALPDLKYKYKLGLTLFLLIYSIIARSDVTNLIVIIFIMIFTLIYFINFSVNDIKKKREIILFLVPLIILYLTAIIFAYFCYADPIITVSTINYKLSLYIIINILIAIWGPNKTLSVEKYFPFPQLRFDKEFSENDLIILGLSAREIDVYKFLIRDYSNIEIAEKMFVDKRTIESHLKNIKDKLGFKSMSELRRYIHKITKKTISP